MTKEITKRLAVHFKKDFKKARFQAGSITTFPSLYSFKNMAEKRRFRRKLMLFEVTKKLYIECINDNLEA